MSSSEGGNGVWFKIRSDVLCHGGWGSALICLGFHASAYYRIAHYFHAHGADAVGRWIQGFSLLVTGADISRRAIIGCSLGIWHPSGILIGPGVLIGDHCNLHQGCSLTPDVWMTRDDSAYPELGDHVYVGAGGRVLGAVKLGNSARVAPNSVVLKDVPEGATALGVPARIIDAAFRHE